MLWLNGDTSVWNRQILLHFCRVNIFFDILIASISWTLAQPPINHIIFSKTVTRTFRCIYVNCFNRLRFLDEGSAQNCRKWTFFGHFKDYNSGSMETRQMAPFFSSTFSTLTVCNIHFYIWKWSKFIFLMSPFFIYSGL